MSDTSMWNEQVQKIVYPAGTPKGKEDVMRDWGVDVRGLAGTQMKATLSKMENSSPRRHVQWLNKPSKLEPAAAFSSQSTTMS